MPAPYPRRDPNRASQSRLNRGAPRGSAQARGLSTASGQQFGAAPPPPAAAQTIVASARFNDTRSNWTTYNPGDTVRLTSLVDDVESNITDFVDIDPDIYSGVGYGLLVAAAGYYQLSAGVRMLAAAGTICAVRIHGLNPAGQSHVGSAYATMNAAMDYSALYGAAASPYLANLPAFYEAGATFGVQVGCSALVTVPANAYLRVVKFA